MNANYKLGLAMLAGFAIGVVAVKGLSAESDPPNSSAQQEPVKRTVLLRSDLGASRASRGKKSSCSSRSWNLG